MFDMSQFIDILQVVLFGLLLAATPFLVVQLYKFLKLKVDTLLEELKETKPEVFDMLAWLASNAVKFAEQTGLGKLGEEKLELAIEYVQRYLDEYGFDEIDVQQIVDAIEVALFEEINRDNPKYTKVSPKYVKASK